MKANKWATIHMKCFAHSYTDKENIWKDISAICLNAYANCESWPETWHLRHWLHVTLETLITLLTIENNIIKNYFVTFILSVTGTAFSILEMFFSQVRAGGVIFILSFSIFASFLLTSTQRFFVWQRSRSDACPYSKIVIVVRTSSLEQRRSATINSNWLFLCNGSVLLLEWGMQGWSNKEEK